MTPSRFLSLRALRVTVCAAAVCALGAAVAQTAPSGSSAPTGAKPSGPAAASAPARPSAKLPQHRAHHPAHQPGQPGKAHDMHPSGPHGRYATPEAHEAAAVRAEERAGRMRNGLAADEYQRNAMARCDVFRDPVERRSCIARVRSAQVTGSVEEGGLLRELTEQVPVQP